MSDAMRTWLRDFANERSFVARYRYYAAVLARVDPVEDPSVPVMAVSAKGRRFYLHVNVGFFLTRPNFLRGVLLHEVHHIVLGHLSNPRLREVRYRDLMQLAMELSANEYIAEPLPGDPPTIAKYGWLGVRGGQSTMERYEILEAARNLGRLPEVTWTFVDSHLPGGAGVLDPDAPPPDPGAYLRVRDLVKDAIQRADAAASGTGPPARLAGRTPGQLIEELDHTDEDPETVMDWKAALQVFVARLRAPVHVYHRPSRRFPHLVGVVPGRAYYPGHQKPPKLLVAIDTSGSMSTNELADIARQLRPLNRLVEFDVVECDAAIHRVYPFRGKIDSFAGRGGTDFRPVFAADFLREHKPAGVIFFTDGDGTWPPADPGVKTLWVLSKPHAFACPWGEKAFMPRASAPVPL